MDVEEGDRIRIDIPDETDPDHYLHGKHGTVETVLQDDAAELTNQDQDSILLQVQLESGEQVDVRERDVRPPIE